MIENVKSYTLGYDACLSTKGDDAKIKVAKNPFVKDTPEWRSWNKGWNVAMGHFL